MLNTKLLSSAAAAAMLLASLGAVLVAQPAAAQYRTQPAAVVAPPVIERFVLRYDDLKPGEQVRFRLVGAPGARAWLNVPGLLRGAPMAEVRPGVYLADYVIRWRDNPSSFERAVATLQRGGQRMTAQGALRDREDGPGYGHGRDNDAPRITDLTPANGDRVGERRRTRISASFSDEGTGVDPASVVPRVDGRDVTGRARFDGDDIRYAEDLQPGRHVAEVVVRDRAGNAARRSWAFNVVDRDRNDGSYGGNDHDRRW
jgi:hypothetical protein